MTAVSIMVKVKPNARASDLIEGDEGVWFAQLKSAPVDGKANAELIALVAAHFDVPKSRVRIARGAGARIKRVEID